MEREAAIRLLRALVAVGLHQRESMANAAIRSVAVQAGLDEFDAAHQYGDCVGLLLPLNRETNARRTGGATMLFGDSFDDNCSCARKS